MSDCEWRTIESAPRDGNYVVILARWDWDGMDGQECDDRVYAQVARWSDPSQCFISASGNPYSDHSVDAEGWFPLPA